MNITGKTMIFKSQYGYSTTISKKNQDGEYERMYVSVQLPKNIELENKTVIEITNGFLSFYNTKDGLPKIKIIIREFTTDEEQKYIQEERKAIQNEEIYGIQDSNLPF
jgi:hypothetical protein